MQKSCWLTQLRLKYSRFKNPEIWLVDRIFEYTQVKNLQIVFYVSWIYIYKPKIKMIHQWLLKI